MPDQLVDQTPGGLSPTSDVPLSPEKVVIAETPAIYEKCITCKDLGVNCKGPSLEPLLTIANVREYHRRLRNYHKISMRQIFALTTKEISDATVKDYFGREEKDFRWTSVALIDNALTYLCGGGTPPSELPICPASSSEIQEQTEAVSKKLLQAEQECAALSAQIAENAEKHIAQFNEFRAGQQDRIDWLKADIGLWRKIAFTLLGVLLIVLVAFFAYIGWDLTHAC